MMPESNDIPQDARRRLGLDAEESKNGEDVYAVYAVYADSKRENKTTPFPIDALPEPCKRLAKESAASINCPPDFVGMPLLVALGTAIGNARRIKLKEGWEEGAALYGAVVADPGEKKTPAQNVAVEAAKKQETKLKRDHREKAREHEAQMRQHEKDKKDCRKNDLVEPEEPEEPRMERAVVEDTTVEALTDVLEGSPRGVLAVKDELAGWVRSMDQYKSGGKGSDRQFWLSVWSNSYVSVDRRGRSEPLTLESPFVGVVGSIQPKVLPELGEGREDGMLDRFLFAYPEPKPSRWSDEEISPDAKDGVRRLYQGLRDLHMPEDDYGEPDSIPISLSSEAKEVFKQAVNELREEMDQPGFSTRLKGPWSKLEGYLARISLILAMARTVEAGDPERVEQDDVLKAIVLVDYFKNQARRVYVGLHGDNPEDRLADDVAGFLRERGGSWTGQPSELYEQLESDYKPERADELSKVLEKIAQQTPALSFNRKIQGYKRDGKQTTRKVLSLSMENGVNGVNGVNGWSEV